MQKNPNKIYPNLDIFNKNSHEFVDETSKMEVDQNTNSDEDKNEEEPLLFSKHYKPSKVNFTLKKELSTILNYPT